jgi:tryptophanyl-tRNA synthetase
VDLGKNVALQIYRAIAPGPAAEMERRLAGGGVGYGELKKELFAALMDHFAPFRQRRAELVKNLDYVREVLREGAERAGKVAEATMARVREAVGLR